MLDIHSSCTEFAMNHMAAYKLRSDTQISVSEQQSFISYSSEQQPQQESTFCFQDPRHAKMGYRMYHPTSIDPGLKHHSESDYFMKRFALNLPESGHDGSFHSMTPFILRLDILNASNLSIFLLISLLTAFYYICTSQLYQRLLLGTGTHREDQTSR
jgi:hypothetical protein